MEQTDIKQDRHLVALAMAAHPDDIEFMMSGTLLLLKQAGAEIHICNLANGCYGSQVYGKEEAARVRALEAQEAARVAGAVWHPSLFDDVGLYYDAASLAKVSAVVREIRPDILLTLSRYDYMEDHEYASRLASSAAFNRCLPSYVTDPPQPSSSKPVAVYHSYVESMADAAREVGRRYGGCEFAEGWRRHNHMGYCAADYAPLETALAPFLKQTK